MLFAFEMPTIPTFLRATIDHVPLLYDCVIVELFGRFFFCDTPRIYSSYSNALIVQALLVMGLCCPPVFQEIQFEIESLSKIKLLDLVIHYAVSSSSSVESLSAFHAALFIDAIFRTTKRKYHHHQ